MAHWPLLQEGADLSQETEESLKKIVAGVEGTALKIGEIAAATDQQADNAEEVSRAIQGISEVTERAAAGSEEMAASSEQLGAQAESLRALVSRFKTDSGQSGQDWKAKTDGRAAQPAPPKDSFSRSNTQKGNGQPGQDDWLTEATTDADTVAV